MSAHCYQNGAIIPVAEAGINVYDIGILRGYGIYEALMTSHRRPFLFADHMTRYRKTAEAMHLMVPVTDEKIHNAITELVERNVPSGEAIVKLIITGGLAHGGIEYDSEQPTFYILVEPFVPVDERYYEHGGSLITFEHLRQFPQLKTTNYIQAVMLQSTRKQAGAIEVLYTWHDTVLECSTSNFFIVKDNTLITAKDEVLLGITRKGVIDVARSHFAIEERTLHASELFSADEAFITSSFKDVLPIVSIGDHVLRDGTVGPVTKRVMQLFKDMKEAN